MPWKIIPPPVNQLTGGEPSQNAFPPWQNAPTLPPLLQANPEEWRAMWTVMPWQQGSTSIAGIAECSYLAHAVPGWPRAVWGKASCCITAASLPEPWYCGRMPLTCPAVIWISLEECNIQKLFFSSGNWKGTHHRRTATSSYLSVDWWTWAGEERHSFNICKLPVDIPPSFQAREDDRLMGSPKGR